jgi:methionine-S-sulfoxide reductase
MRTADEITGETADELDTDPGMPDNFETATFALGCFWGPDALFGGLKGVLRTRVGYTGGTKSDPTYESLGGHSETVQLDYDPEQIGYDDLLQVFWSNHDYHVERKPQYASKIFVHNDEQREKAERTLKEREQKSNVATEIAELGTFWIAEDYHQKYYLRQHPETAGELEEVYSPEEFINSYTAMMLNAFYGGNLADLPPKIRGLKKD